MCRPCHQSGTHNDDTQAQTSTCSIISCRDETDSNALDLAKNKYDKPIQHTLNL